MQHFKDKDGEVWAYEDDVDVPRKTGPNGPLPSIPDGLTAYTPPTPTAADELAAAKAKQRATINTARAAAVSQPVKVSQVPYDAGPVSRQNISSTMVAVLAGKVTFPIGWRDVNNKTQSLSQAQFTNVATAVYAQVEAAYDKSFTLKDEIDTADSIAAVQSIVWI